MKVLSVVVATTTLVWNEISNEMKEDMRQRMIERDGYVCNQKYGYGCGAQENLTMDHIIPISMGGNVCDISNIQFLCKKCHENKTEMIDRKRIEKRFYAC